MKRISRCYREDHDPAHADEPAALLCDLKEDSTTYLISMVIPVYNGGEMFRRCLEAIQEADPAPDELIVVADGETDGSADMARRFGAKVISLPAVRGPSVARNIGARSASGDIIFFVDADVIIQPSAITKVTEVFGNHPEISALIGSYDDSPGAPNFLSQYKNLFHHYTHQQAREEGYTFWGACGAIRREVFLDVGGFDETIRRPCMEDVELGYRLKAAGHRILLRKDLQVKHLKQWKALSLFRTDFFQRAIPWTQLILQSGSFENDLNISISSRVKVALTFTLLGVVGLSLWYPAVSELVLLVLISLLIMDAKLLRFFQKKRGLMFALQTIPWHWFYYIFSGLAFFIGFTDLQIKRIRSFVTR